MNIKIPAVSLRAALLFIAKRHDVYAINHVRVRRHRIDATNGKQLVSITLPEGGEGDDVLISAASIKGVLLLKPNVVLVEDGYMTALDLEGKTIGGIHYETQDGTFPDADDVIQKSRDGESAETTYLNAKFLEGVGKAMGILIGKADPSYKVGLRIGGGTTMFECDVKGVGRMTVVLAPITGT